MRRSRTVIVSLLLLFLVGCTAPPTGEAVSVERASDAGGARETTTEMPSALARLIPTPTLPPAPTELTLPSATPTALTPAQQIALARLGDLGPAPELTNALWFNSPPLRLADLRGKVVIVEFWTYG